MKVISKKSTRRLVKGGVYNVIQIWNDGTSNPYREGKCEIEDIGYSCKTEDFTNEDGTPIGSVKFEVKRDNYFSDLKNGDILVSKYDAGKSFVKDQMYVVEDTKEISKNHTGIYGNRTTVSRYVKFQGFPRWYKFSPWRFQPLPKERVREISLDEILLNKKSPTITKRENRSIDSIENRDALLIKILSNSVSDKYRKNLGVIDWAVEKIGNKYGVQKKDFDHLLEVPLKDILKQIDLEK